MDKNEGRVTKQKKRIVYRFWAILAVISLLLGALVHYVGDYFDVVLTVAMEGSTTDEEKAEETYAAGLEMNKELEAEGMVLLKNEDGTLPLSEKKINLFGEHAVDLIYNGAGSSAGTGKGAVTLKEGLEAAGFTVNETLLSLIEEKSGEGSDSKVHEGNEVDISNYPINEMSVDNYTDECSFEKLKEYSDTAVVVIGRSGGEGQDLPRSGYGEDGTAHYLELSENEKALFTALKENGFQVTVLINSSYAMELGFLDQEEYGIRAALWIGGPGLSGAASVGEALAGEVNPSGRLADTWAYDLTTQSSYIGSDYYYYLYAENTEKELGGFTNYSEGIYMGYRWYETADAEGYWEDVSNEFGSGYEGVVQYPFGYGLSYTTFSQKLVSAEYQDGVYTFEVEVENTGNVYAGKEVVQIYAETPYENGGTEKSKVVLCAFAKTKSLEPGEKVTCTLTVDEEDLASYDETAENGVGAYVLDAGDYKFYLSDNAHSWAQISEDDSERYYQNTCEKIVYSGENKRSSDAVAAENQFEGSDNGITTLSRADGFANAEEAILSEVEDVLVEKGTDLFDNLITNAAAYGEYQGEAGSTETGQEGTLTLDDMAGISYDDEKWDTFLSQLTVDDMNTLIGTGGWSTAAIDSIGKSKTTDIDGPYGLSNYVQNEMGVSEGVCVSYCSEAVMAATWNVELLGRLGETIGDEANATGVSGWYAPGANLHRTSFGGRNAEYFSEDPFLSGKICAAEVSGALSKGLYVYIKHFAFNDTEANRTNKQNCWMTEQTARELYLKPFEIAVKEGGATGLMSSYMWINGTWCGGNYNLLTNVARGEWGFTGMIVTDNYCGSWMDTTKAIMAGTDLILSNTLRSVDEGVMATDEGILAMKRACKNILYTISDAASKREVKAESGFNWWQLTYDSTRVIFFGAAVVFALLFLVEYKKSKKQAAR